MHPDPPSPYFPNEIYTEILRHLHYRQDKLLLLSLALVSQALRHESQKILFSNIDEDGDHALRSNYDGIRLHTLFLQAVIDHPQRLGPYVLSYTQENVARGLESGMGWESIPGEHLLPSMQVWELTRNALPAMINLRSLFFRAKTGYSSGSLLRHCNFQLQTLIWQCDESNSEYLATFLATQRRLHHFEFGFEPPRENLGWLTSNACPNLISASLNITSISILTHWRKIVALDLDMDRDEAVDIQAEDNYIVLRRLKYMRMDSWLFDVGFPGIVLPNIVILDIGRWYLVTLECLASFPNLRLLVLRAHMAMTHDKNMLREAVRRGFERCPRLERVVSHDIHDRSSYTTFTITRTEDDTQVHVKEQTTHHNPSHVWWIRYNV